MSDDQSLVHAEPSKSIISPCASSQQSRIEWLWRSNSEPDEWCAHTDVETAMIEEAFQQKLPEAILDDYTISFKHFIQVSRYDTSNQRPVKRVNENGKMKFRTARFMPSPINPSAPFGHRQLGGFRWATHELYNLPGFNYTHDDNCLLDAVNRQAIIRRAAEGIVLEGMKVGKQLEGERMAKLLLDVIDGTAEEVWRVCARLYTMESFLYKKLNECMRLEVDKKHEEMWKSKVETFGPFSSLLYYLGEYTGGKMTVYRGCNLSDDLIEKHRQHRMNAIVFPAFTSTSRNCAKAELIGNVLYVIDIDGNHDGCDVSPYSLFDEEEHLLAPYFMFYIQSCMFDKNKGKWIIHLQSTQVA